MEKTSTTKRKPKTTKRNIREEVINGYIDYVLMHGEEPASIYAFCKHLKIEEHQFYANFNDFGQIGEHFWLELFNEVKNSLHVDPDFVEFSVREKCLSLYYAFFEKLKSQRSFAIMSFKESIGSFKRENRQLSAMKKAYKEWVKQMVSEGLTKGEVAGRSKLTSTYDDLFWIQFLFLMNFWKNDRSKDFEKTDAAIEKTVHLSFDLIEKNALDSALDFGKFIFQNR
jgi:hypothetical protein